ncbi:MBL fold metallo-hydrolase [Candidatus Peregrinibacteria bacterium]|nr:MBL fold metallo-hydrolase [Candidatus Peregrinibacteria bacterium]
MKIQFFGAAQEVTGSKHMIEVNGKRIFLDFGMHQGKREESNRKNRELPIEPSKIDAMLLSHAHIDHSGNIPTLVKNGYKGPIYATHATRDICAYMLLDSGFIQEREAEYLNERLKKKKKPLIEPVYTADDARQALTQFVGMSYDHPFEVAPGVVASFRDAGHILGSAQVVLIIDDSETKKQWIVVFTGDLGRKNLPLLRDPYQVERADIIIMESTYGNRFHKSILDVSEQLEKIVNNACKKGGKIIIPAFALERTQEIVYHLNILFKEKRIPEIPIFVDSPLAVNLTEIFTAHPECLDKETWEIFLNDQKNPFGFGRLKYITDVEDSKALNDYRGPCVIISAAGMCEHGRILHHLKNNVENPANTILIVGYMAENTLGRKILEKQAIVKIFGEPYHLRANVVVMDAFSAHADRSDLLDYLAHIRELKKIFLVHGEVEQGMMFKNILLEEGFKDIDMPAPGEIFNF